MNIVIDGNAFLNVATSIVKNILAQNRSIGERYYVGDLIDHDKYILKEASKNEFRKFSLNYLGSIFAPFKENIESVFIVFDSRSWRREFIKDNAIEFDSEDFEYKGKRKYDEKSYLFFDYFQEDIMPKLVEEYGVITSRLPGAEGDDLIAYICEAIPNEDICIWTVDKDLIQLVERKNRKVILIMPKMMTKYKKVYTTDDFDEIVEQKVDLFNLDISAIDNSAVVNILSSLLSKEYQHFKIDATFEIIQKILAGDPSDTIPRLHSKLTASKVNKVIEKVKETFDWHDVKNLIDLDDSKFTNALVNIICDVLKIKDSGESGMILNNYRRNRTLMRLNTSFFPVELVKQIKESLDLTDRRRFSYFKFKKNYKS